VKQVQGDGAVEAVFGLKRHSRRNAAPDSSHTKTQRHKDKGTAPFPLLIGVALEDRLCRFFRQKKKDRKEKRKPARTHPASCPSFFFLFFLPANPLAQSFGGPVPSQAQTAGTNELNKWQVSTCYAANGTDRNVVEGGPWVKALFAFFLQTLAIGLLDEFRQRTAALQS
jgi:hypothetical protein